MFNRPAARFPLITAHSGAEGTEANSMEFVRVAAAACADYVELDLRITQDGIPVFMHDPAIVASDGGYMFVANTDYAFLNEATGGTLSPALDILSAMVEADVSVNLDIKDICALESISGFIRDARLSRRMILSGIHLEQAVDIREDYPDFFCMLNLDTELDEGVEAEKSEDIFNQYLEAAVELGCPILNLEHVYCRRELVELAHRKGVGVSVWTPDSKELFHRFLDMEVDLITTNKVTELKKLIE